MLQSHARVHSIFDADLGAGPRAVFRKVAVETKDRQTESFCSGLKVTIAAGEIVAGVALCRIAHLRPDMRVGCGDEIAAAPHHPAVIAVRKRTDLGHGPDRPAGRLRALGVTMHRQQRQRCDGGQRQRRAVVSLERACHECFNACIGRECRRSYPRTGCGVATPNPVDDGLAMKSTKPAATKHIAPAKKNAGK